MSTDGIKVIFSIWGHRDGYVFVPVKDGDRWIERSFKWPEGRSLIRKWIKQCIKNKASVYWCPTIFTAPKRIKENITTSINLLWADLDEVHPSEIGLRPTIAWESSPKRYQCLWLLKRRIDANKAEKINKELTYTIGADKGGWDLTQVLRIPGLRNWKYKNGPKGRLMWDDGKIYSYKRVKKFTKLNITKGNFNESGNLDEDVQTILAKYSKRLPQRVFELFFTPNEEVSVGERSDRLWELECLLAESGISTRDIITLVKKSPWNKFEGRRNEDEQIENEVYKAKDRVKTLGTERAIELGSTGIVTPVWKNYEDIMGQRLTKPEYLIKEVWQDKSHGFVAGEPKTYKSVITTDLAVSVASGEPFLNKFEVVNQGPVLVVQEENHPYLVQDRLRKMAHSKGLLTGTVKETKKGFQITFPPVLPIRFLNQYGFDFTNEQHREVIQNEIKRFKPVLVIFDPLYLMLGGVDENNSKDLRPILNWLLELRYAYDTGIMLVHHWNKAGISNRGGQRMLGSTTLHAWVESAMYCSIKDEAEYSIVVERELRSFPKPKNIVVKFNIGEPGELTYYPEVNEEKLNTMDDILSIINSGINSEEELRYATGLPRGTLRDRLNKAITMGLIERVKDKNRNYYVVRRGYDEGIPASN